MNRIATRTVSTIAPLCLAIVLAADAATTEQQLAFDIFKELVEINTVTEIRRYRARS